MVQTTKTVREHDFRRTELIERVHLQALQGLLEAFTRSATQQLTSTLRQHCAFSLEKLDQVTWRDLAEELERDMYFFTFSLSPLTGRAVLAIPTEEVLAFVDLRLAGAGDDDFSGRVPSEIDQAFLAPIIEVIVGELSNALSRIQATVPLLEAQEGNVQFVSIASPAEMCMAARLSFAVAARAPATGVVVPALFDGPHAHRRLAEPDGGGRPEPARLHGRGHPSPAPRGSPRRRVPVPELRHHPGRAADAAGRGQPGPGSPQGPGARGARRGAPGRAGRDLQFRSAQGM